MTQHTRPLISICVPVYNEEENILPLYERLTVVFNAMAAQFDFELLFTDNHSGDNTFVKLAELSAKDRRVRVIRFSRNFGFQRSILANYINARGQAAIQIDCDLQDPPELIPEFLRKWQEGYRVVYGIRCARERESFFTSSARRLFYRLINSLSQDSLPLDAGDFRLIDRLVIEQLRHVRDQQPYLRGLIAAMGFRQVGIPYNRDARERGVSKFNLWRLLSLAVDGILNHSTAPLRLATGIGFLMCALAAAGVIYFTVNKLFLHGNWPPGIASISVLVLFSIGLNALLLGILGEYIGRIFKNVKEGPLVIVEDIIDHHGKD